jgi:hypothetical protein
VFNVMDFNGLWTVGGPANPTLNTIVCDGKGGIRAQIGSNFPPVLLPCVQVHEQSHAYEALAANPGICVGQGDGIQVLFSSAAEQKASEIQASLNEIFCLENQKCSNPMKQQVIDDRIDQVKAYAASFK